MRALPKAGAPGSAWNYSTGETYLIGPVIEGAPHKPLATYLSEALWSRLGMEQDATWWLESPGGMGLAGSGIGATLRDYGRIGLVVQQDGMIDGQRLVSEGWFRESGSAYLSAANLSTMDTFGGLYPPETRFTRAPSKRAGYSVNTCTSIPTKS